MDVRHSHGTEVFVVRACYEDDAADLVAIGGAHSVEVILLVCLPALPSAPSTQLQPCPVRFLLQDNRKLPHQLPRHRHSLVVARQLPLSHG